MEAYMWVNFGDDHCYDEKHFKIHYTCENLVSVYHIISSLEVKGSLQGLNIFIY